MTNPSPPPAVEPDPSGHHDQQGPRPSRNEVLDLGRLRRSVDDRRIAGVSSGLARHLDIDPIIVRVAMVVLVFFGGSGLLLYGAAWLLVPEEGSPAQPLGLDDRNRNIALMGTGILAALAAVGDFAGAFWFPWPLVIIALLVVWFLNRKDQGQPIPGTEQTDAPGQAYAPYQPYQPHQPYQPYQPYQQPTYVRPRSPRKRGPILFWFTLALIATGVGTLGIIDVSGATVPAAAYPALALALTGAMLLLGAFWGRAGGLILIGLMFAAATLGATAIDEYESTPISYTPTASAEVRESYNLDVGELVVDLSDVEDVDGLDGHELSIEGGLGAIEVVVPDGMDVSVDASTGAGDINVFGERTDGVEISRDGFLDGGDDVPDLRINIDLAIGEVTVREQ